MSKGGEPTADERLDALIEEVRTLENAKDPLRRA